MSVAKEDLDAKLAEIAWHLPHVSEHAAKLGIALTMNLHHITYTSCMERIPGVEGRSGVHRHEGVVVGACMRPSSFTAKTVTMIKQHYSPVSIDIYYNAELNLLSLRFIYDGAPAARDT